MRELVFGINAVSEALKGQRRVYKIYAQRERQDKRLEEILTLVREKQLKLQYLEKKKMDELCEGKHQGIIAEVERYPYADLGQVLEKLQAQKDKPPFLLLLDGIEDPQNLGAIIRTAECAGVDGIIIPSHKSAEVNPTVSRVSAGAVEHMAIIRENNLVNTIKYLKQEGFWVLGADAKAQQNYFNTSIPSPTALVIGGEGQGIRRLVRENCDILVKIPMFGQLNSLNASVAAALLIYEVLRQRLNLLPG